LSLLNTTIVLRHAIRVERLQYAANLQIHLLDHAPVSALRAAVKMKQALEALRLRLVTRRLPRPVRRVEVQTEEKGLPRLCIRIDHVDRAISQQVRQISGVTDLDVVFPQILGIGRRWPVFMREVIEHAGAEAVEMIVSALQWTEIGQPAQTPLADQGRLVAGLLQDRRQGRVLRW
jgi:hypothetical protein